jgi:hypothetical protein
MHSRYALCCCIHSVSARMPASVSFGSDFLECVEKHSKKVLATGVQPLVVAGKYDGNLRRSSSVGAGTAGVLEKGHIVLMVDVKSEDLSRGSGVLCLVLSCLVRRSKLASSWMQKRTNSEEGRREE